VKKETGFAQTFFVAIVGLCLLLVSADGEAIDRRRDQFQTESGYYVFPFPYSLPGVGDGVALLGVVPNVSETHADIFGYVLQGDLKGVGVTASDIHLVDRHLIMDVSGSSFNKVSLQAYNTRGISGDKDDYLIMEMDDNDFFGSRLTATWLDRMFEFYLMGYTGYWQLSAIRDKDGELIQATDSADREDFQAYAAGSRIDYTDDYLNPRVGLRFDLTARHSPRREDYAPDQFAMQYNFTGYYPFRRWDTLVFNYYQADAHVRKEGETDPLAVQGIMGLDCTLGTADQQADCLKLVDNVVAGNKYGTVDGLGGTSRLRSYPMGRYNAAHTQFAGIEYRWNLTDESTPFDIFIAKDVRSALQLAFFYEIGTVADRRRDLGEKMRHSYGIGGRLVTESGMVIRADVAHGREGLGVTIIAGFPWESF